MEVAHIYPRELNWVSKYNTMELVLYHWVKKHKDYRKFMKNNKNYKIFDNSFYELRESIDYEDFVEEAIKLKVDEIVLPDVLWDGEKTRELSKWFIDKFKHIREEYGIKFAFVVQGRDLKDILYSINFANANKFVDVIMIPRKIFKLHTYYEGRKHVLTRFIDIINKPIHLLGANSFGDFFQGLVNIRSIDTKLLVKLVLQERRIEWDMEIKQPQTTIITKFEVLNNLINNFYGVV